MASIIERIDLGGASNLMRVLISLTAPPEIPDKINTIQHSVNVIIVFYFNSLQVFNLISAKSQSKLFAVYLCYL